MLYAVPTSSGRPAYLWELGLEFKRAIFQVSSFGHVTYNPESWPGASLFDESRPLTNISLPVLIGVREDGDVVRCPDQQRAPRIPVTRERDDRLRAFRVRERDNRLRALRAREQKMLKGHLPRVIYHQVY